MIDDQLSPEERQLVQKIQAVAKPKLEATARETIRQSMLSEFRGTLPPGQPHAPRMRPRFSFPTTPIWVAAAVVVLVVGLLIVIQNGTSNHAALAGSSTPTATPEQQIVVAPTQTAPVPVVAPTATEGVTITPLVSPEFIPSLTRTLPPTTAQVAPSGTPVPLPTLTTESVVTIEGPVTSITDNVVTIYGFQIEVAPQHPILQIIDVGDVVRVEGVLDSSGVVLAAVVSNLPDAAPAADSRATVGLDGPVEAINGNILIVNGISVQLAPNDPLLQTVLPGSFVSVQGNFETSNAGIVLVVVNIAIVNNISVESGCWYHVDAMGMGHWHCDGMGMGMGNDGMGMGMGDAMGMGG